MKESPGQDWRARTLDRLRQLILEADPQIVEERKWRKASNPEGVPAFSRGGMVCTVETYKDHVKLTFPNGAIMKDPGRLFNANLEGVRRAIDIHEGDGIDGAAFKALIREAVALNLKRK